MRNKDRLHYILTRLFYFLVINIVILVMIKSLSIGYVEINFTEISAESTIDIYYYNLNENTPHDQQHRMSQRISPNGKKFVGAASLMLPKLDYLRIDLGEEQDIVFKIQSLKYMNNPFVYKMISGENFVESFSKLNEVEILSTTPEEVTILTMGTDPNISISSNDYVYINKIHYLNLAIGLIIEIALLVFLVAKINKDVSLVQQKSQIVNYYNLDVLKFILSFMIVALHFSPFENINAYLSYFVTQGITRVAVPLFFTVSGFLFYNKVYNTQRKQLLYNRDYLYKYCNRVFGLYIFWNIFYVYFARIHQDVPVFLTVLFLQGGYWQLWYLLSTCLAIPFAYYMFLKFGKKTTYICAFLVYYLGVLLDGGYWSIWQSNRYTLPAISFYQQIFPRGGANFFFFGFPFIVVGAMFVIEKDKIDELLKKEKSIILAVVFTLAVAVEAFLLLHYGHPQSTSLYFTLPLAVIFLMQATLCIRLSSLKHSNMLRGCSSLIYLLHPISITLVNHYSLGTTNSFVKWLAVCVITVCMSLCYMAAAKHIELLRKFY